MWKWKWPLFRKERRRQRQREKKRRNQRLTTESCKFSNMTTKIFPSIGNGKPQKNQIPRSHFPLKAIFQTTTCTRCPSSAARPSCSHPLFQSFFFSFNAAGKFSVNTYKNTKSSFSLSWSSVWRQDSTQPLTTSSKTVKTRLSRRWSSL